MKSLAFRFADEALNQRLIQLLAKTGVQHRVAKDGTIHYSPNDEETVENDLISSIRDDVFSGWGILFCPASWAASYREYMSRREIPFKEELRNEQLCFLIPRK